MSEAKAIAEQILKLSENYDEDIDLYDFVSCELSDDGWRLKDLRALCEAVVGAAEVDAKLRDLVDARDGLSTLDEVRETINYYEHKMGNNYWPPQKEDEFKAQARRIADLEAQLEAVEKEKHENG